MVKRMGDVVLVSHSWDEKIPSKNSVEKEVARDACCVCEEAIEDDQRITGLSDIDKDAVNTDSRCGVGVVDGCREKRVSVHLKFTWISSSGGRLELDFLYFRIMNKEVREEKAISNGCEISTGKVGVSYKALTGEILCRYRGQEIREE